MDTHSGGWDDEQRAAIAEFSSALHKMSDQRVKAGDLSKRRAQAKHEAKDPEWMPGWYAYA